jgi:hypothetical protein
VGDSLNRNQWESMVCLVQSAVAPDKKYVKWEGQGIVFHAWVRLRTPSLSLSPSLRFVPAGQHNDRPKLPPGPARGNYHRIQKQLFDLFPEKNTIV